MSLLEWYIPLGLLALLLWILLRRHTYRTYPWFFAYTAFGLTASFARFLVHNQPKPYYAVYYISEAFYDVFGILVMYEVLNAVLGNMSRYWWVRLAFLGTLLGCVGLSLERAHAVPTQFVRRMAFCIVTGEIAVRFVEVFIFAGLVTLVPILGLRWRQHSFGIATGFGVYATVMLLTTTKLSDFGTKFMYLWNLVSFVAYSLAVLIWIWFFSVPEKNATPGSRLSAPSPGVLEEYKNAMRRMR